MKPTLLDHLACPEDGSSLELHDVARDGTEILSGSLRCEKGHVYPVTGGVPRMAGAEAKSSEARQTQDSFSRKWRRIPDFGHETASRDVYWRWYLERYGFGDVAGLRRFLADRGRVLDAGTGLGRDAVLYGENAPGEVFALDLSESIDFAYRHAGQLENVHLLQGDLTRLPFPRGHFDYIASDQVIHHTADTEAAFKSLTEFLAPGGQIAVYVYKKKGPIREFSDDFLREHYTGASEEECYAFSRAMTLLGKALTDLNAEIEVPEDIPILEIEAGRYDLQRFLYWNVLKCYWNEDLGMETSVMTNFDWYHPRFAHRHTPEEVRGWCADTGLEIVHFDVVESGISVRAKRP